MGTTTAVLIPAYKPDERLLTLLKELKTLGFERLIVVDDGGGEVYRSIFEKAAAAGARVLTHKENRGKGAALKTGLEDILQNDPCGVVTADADGQHTARDILRIADALSENPDALVLGVRDKKQMPLRSKIGNTLTCWTLGLISGLWIADTQTGLRGLPADALKDLAGLTGDRYEYEMNVLLHVRKERIPVRQVVIETIYIDNNKGSSFHVLRDSGKIYLLLFRQMIAFLSSSAISAAIDLTLFTVIHYLYPGHLLLTVVSARAVSATANYFINRNVVFKAGQNLSSALRYFALAVVLMLSSYYIIRLLTLIYIPTVVAKVMGDGILLFVSYGVQKKLVFPNRGKRKP